MENTSVVQPDILNKLNNYYQEKFDFLISEIIKICEIPAPTFEEDPRGDYVIERMQSIPRLIIQKDKFKNIIIRYPGVESKAKLAILAHLDTVFPLSKIEVKKTSDSLTAPGIGDNSTSVGVLLHIIESWDKFNFIPPFDILFVTNACEEGLGDLKGVRGLLDDYCSNAVNKVDLKTLLSIDGTIERVTHIGTGVKRYKIEINSKGGHSWSDFNTNGIFSAIHIIGTIIADISMIKVPEVPKTTYNVGIVEGGTSINTIASNASILIDFRSTSDIELARLDGLLMNIVNYHTKNVKNVRADITIVGNRPSGKIPFDHPLVQKIKEAAEEIKLSFIPTSGVASTDANIPLSRNIPAVAFGCYSGVGAHTESETVQTKSLIKGVPFTNLSIIKTIDWLMSN